MDHVKHAAESAQAATNKIGVGASADQMDPSSPYTEGQAVTVKVDPSDPNTAMIFGKG
jgi:hypothetical protein